MDPSSLLYALIFIVLLLMSALFSGSETAFLSLTKSNINQFARSKHTAYRQVAFLMQEPKKLLICIIIGNTIANVAIASAAALLTTRLSMEKGLDPTLILIINVVVVTLVILFFSEIVPKVMAVRSAKAIVVKAALPLTFFYYLFYPLIQIFDVITHLLSNSLGVRMDKTKLSEAELRTLVDVGEEMGALKKDEKQMIHSIFEMSDTVAREIMVPRTDMVCIEKLATLNQVLAMVKDKLHSRIPVYAETIDNIVGILYLKDLMPYIKRRNQTEFDLTKIVRPPYYVPEQKRINELLREYQTEKIHMAIVVDEYGGTSGLVTLEDVIEEIVGEIQDEYDKELPQFEKINDNTFLVNGSMLIDEINEQLNLDLPTEEGVDTLAGFLLGQFGSVPRSKEKVTYNGYEFIIEKATKKRIQQVRIFKKKKE